MCGVFGFSTTDASYRPDLTRASVAMRHRGPDDEGHFAWEHGAARTGFAHARLSILDLSPLGHQPMTSPDRRYTLVYNGEIYNHKDVRDALRAAGAPPPRSTGDTETLLLALATFGKDALRRLRGMFAIALWDARDRTLLLVRDRLGVKPLYVYTRRGSIAFASEVRTLLASGACEPRLDRAALDGYLAFGSFPEPRTPVEGVVALPPGSWLEWRDGTTSAGRYYDLPLGDAARRTRADAIQELRGALEDSVRLRLEADVPVGVFLSSGIDSTAVATVASRVARDPVHTFTVTFDEAAWDEGGAARRIARGLGTEHHEVRLSAHEIGSDLEVAVRAYDLPSADGVNTFVVSRAARAAGLRVALSGIGGDELFAGYTTFRRFALLRRILPAARALSPLRRGFLATSAMTALPNRARKAAALLASPLDTASIYAEFRGMFTDAQRKALLPGGGAIASDLDDFARHVDEALRGGALDPISAYGILELHGYVRSTLLRDTDAMSMAHSLEVREPLLDHELVDAAFRVAGAEKMRGLGNKPLLAEAVGGIAADVRTQAKKGFTLPFEVWLRGPARAWAEDRLRASVLPEVGFDRAGLRSIADAFFAGAADARAGQVRISAARVSTLVHLADWLARSGVR